MTSMGVVVWPLSPRIPYKAGTDHVGHTVSSILFSKILHSQDVSGKRLYRLANVWGYGVEQGLGRRIGTRAAGTPPPLYNADVKPYPRRLPLRLWHRVVERFKLRLRDALENRIKQKGGVTHAIIREAFLNWDADASGKLDPEELVRIFDYLWAWW